jgi:hypothetical protein
MDGAELNGRVLHVNLANANQLANAHSDSQQRAVWSHDEWFQQQQQQQQQQIQSSGDGDMNGYE